MACGSGSASRIVGWYGPLIDLSECASYIGHYVQLLVLVQTIRPIRIQDEKKLKALPIQVVDVGDETRSFFPLTVWHKQIASKLLHGDVIFLQNVQILKFGTTLEAKTMHFSSFTQLVHPYQSLVSKAADELLSSCRVGRTTKEKLKKVIEWARQAKATFYSLQERSYQNKQVFQNWKRHGERKCYDCISISEISILTISCNAFFRAFVGEIFLPSIGRSNEDTDKEGVFISRRLRTGDTKLPEDLFCLGCKLCGCSLDSDSGSSVEQNRYPFYCQKSSNQLHIVCMIYRPFLLYVWDESECISLHVTNNAAELLFGNITADRVYSSYAAEKKDPNSNLRLFHVTGSCDKRDSALTKAAGEESLNINEGSPQWKHTQQQNTKRKPNLYKIWLILLKLLLQQGKNSCLRFEVSVDPNLKQENGRFSLVSVIMPCTNHGK